MPTALLKYAAKAKQLPTVARPRHTLSLLQKACFATRNDDNQDHRSSPAGGKYDELNRPPPTNIRAGNQVRKYDHDSQVDKILASSAEVRNELQKNVYRDVVLTSAAGMFKNYKTKNKQVREDTNHVIKYLSSNLDGRSFTMFNKLCNDLRVDVLSNANHTLSQDSFLVFLDKVRDLTPFQDRNEQIIWKLGTVDISMMTPSRLMENYQENSVDFKFEKTIRMDEIRQFASNVVPKPRFIFDNYKVDEVKYAQSSEQVDQGDQSEAERFQRDEITRIEQEKHDSDYFSFFKSHENIILKPESNFKGLRNFLTHLPIDYYILLQEGYDEQSTSAESKFATTNYLYVQNIPLLSKRKTHFKNTSPIKTILHEDIFKCSVRFEAEKILEDPYAEEEMLRHLSERYGEIEDHFFINYDLERILNRVGLANSSPDHELIAMKAPLEQDMENYMEKLNKPASKRRQDAASISDTDHESILEASNFESLMLNMSKSEIKGDADPDDEVVGGRPFTKQELFDQKRKAKLDAQRAESERSHLQRPITRQSFIKFADYSSKLRMMDTALFLFGLKLHQQDKHVMFFDADFLNMLQVWSTAFHNRTLGEVRDMINQALQTSGYAHNKFQVGKLKEIDGFNLSQAMIGNNQKMRISLRFNSFEEALDAQIALSAQSLIDSQGRSARINTDFFEPEPIYYDGKFSTKFEGCIKDKFQGLNAINEIRSDYVKKNLIDRGIQPMNRFAQLLNPDLQMKPENGEASQQ